MHNSTTGSSFTYVSISMPIIRNIRPRTRVQMQFHTDGSVGFTNENANEVREFASLAAAVEYVQGMKVAEGVEVSFYDAEGNLVRQETKADESARVLGGWGKERPAEDQR